jgi:uncharacterized protein (DUF885 family)
VGIASVAACAEAPPERSIDDFLQEFTDEWVRMDPDLAVRAQYFDGGEQDRLSRRLTPATVAWKRDRIQLAREGLAELGTFDADSLTDGQLLSADVMRWQLQSLVASEPYLDYEFPLQQFNGVNVTVPSALTVVHPVRNEREAENYAARLRQVDDRMDEATAESQRLAARGVLPPRFILESTIAQMEQFIAPSPAENPLVTVFATKMQAAKLAASTQETLLRDAISVVEGEVYSAWQKAISTLRAQISSATDDAGLWRFGDGADLYADRLRFFTTTSLSAEEIHQTGIDEVSRIEAEMDQRLRELGYEDGSVRDRVAQLEADVAYPNTDKGRAAIMADIDDILADALVRTQSLFDVRPESPVVAEPYPEFMWATAAARYNPPPPDGSRPGIFQVPLRPNRLTKLGLRTIVYHESVPGHHFQIALAVENPDLPAFRRINALGFISASAEGWALYGERLAAEAGWYDGDVVGLIGQLNDALWRARRLVVDTGLHAMGWSRQQAIDYGIEASEVERYVIWPGQACSYMIGQLRIVELRERARDTLGERFSIQEFHNLVLGLGVVPLTVLEQEVDAYISRISVR